MRKPSKKLKKHATKRQLEKHCQVLIKHEMYLTAWALILYNSHLLKEQAT